MCLLDVSLGHWLFQVPIGNGSEEMEAVITIDVLRRAGAAVTVASVEDQLEVTCKPGTHVPASLRRRRFSTSVGCFCADHRCCCVASSSMPRKQQQHCSQWITLLFTPSTPSAGSGHHTDLAVAGKSPLITLIVSMHCPADCSQAPEESRL